MDIQTILDHKPYLLKKVDFFATYIRDFFGLSDRELNSLQTYDFLEESRINLDEEIPNEKTLTFNQYLNRNSIDEKRSIYLLPI